METRAEVPSLAAVLSALQLAYQPAQRSRLLNAGTRAKASSVRMEEEETTLTEDEYAAAVAAEEAAEAERLMREDPEMYAEIERINRGMQDKDGKNLAPWMNIDAKALIEDERRREERAKLWAQNENAYDESKAKEEMNFRIMPATDLEMSWDPPARADFEGLNLERRFPGYGEWEALVLFDADKSANFIQEDPYSRRNSYIDLDLPEGGVEYRVVAVEYDGSKTVLQKGKYNVVQEKEALLPQIIAWFFILVLLGTGVYFTVTGQVTYE
jgi:hypothetical protein